MSHEAKIARIVEALKAAGELPPGLRPVEFRRRIFDMALELGYHARELPSRSAIDRWLVKSGKMGSVLNDAPA